MNYNKRPFSPAMAFPASCRTVTAPKSAFSGRSNVGKSSLINKLCNRKNLARVSSTPGKTGHHQFL